MRVTEPSDEPIKKDARCEMLRINHAGNLSHRLCSMFMGAKDGIFATSFCRIKTQNLSHAMLGGRLPTVAYDDGRTVERHGFEDPKDRGSKASRAEHELGIGDELKITRHVIEFWKFGWRIGDIDAGRPRTIQNQD